MVIGAGPAGLMAADVLSAGGVAVTLADQMPSVGRKFLMAGKSGLNLTKMDAEFGDKFQGPMVDMVADFGPDDVEQHVKRGFFRCLFCPVFRFRPLRLSRV